MCCMDVVQCWLCFVVAFLRGIRSQEPVHYGSGAFGDIPLSKLLHLAISASQFLRGRGLYHRSEVSNTTSHHNKLHSSAYVWGLGAS
jgi:hypothetical protein